MAFGDYDTYLAREQDRHDAGPSDGDLNEAVERFNQQYDDEINAGYTAEVTTYGEDCVIAVGFTDDEGSRLATYQFTDLAELDAFGASLDTHFDAMSSEATDDWANAPVQHEKELVTT